MSKLFVHTGSRAGTCSSVGLRYLVPHCLPHPPALPHPAPLSHHTLLLWPCCPQTTPAGPCCCSGQSFFHEICCQHNLICLHVPTTCRLSDLACIPLLALFWHTHSQLVLSSTALVSLTILLLVSQLFSEHVFSYEAGTDKLSGCTEQS